MLYSLVTPGGRYWFMRWCTEHISKMPIWGAEKSYIILFKCSFLPSKWLPSTEQEIVTKIQILGKRKKCVSKTKLLNHFLNKWKQNKHCAMCEFEVFGRRGGQQIGKVTKLLFASCKEGTKKSCVGREWGTKQLKVGNQDRKFPAFP